MKRFYSLLFALFFWLTLVAQITFNGDHFTSAGPYIIQQDQGWESVTIQDDVLRRERLNGFPNAITVPALDMAMIVTIPVFIVPPCRYPAADSLFVLSDVHGQCGAMVDLLQGQGIIDQQLNWNFGSGHLVVNGDVFDRGMQVNEALWLIYRLQQQAPQTGGAVHLLLGNHEVMALRGDDRYVMDALKERAAQIGAADYAALYGPSTLLGKWLRSLNTIEQIGDLLFVHAGISPTLMQSQLTYEDINNLVRRSLDASRESLLADSLMYMLLRSPGPVWYRGYFPSKKKPQLTSEQVEQIMQTLDAAAVIVGHTTQDTVSSLYGGRVLAVDSGLKRGKATEGLVIIGNQRWRGLADGSRKRIK